MGKGKYKKYYTREKMEFGNKIYELRKNLNLSQEQLAEKLNVTRQTISNWELGQTVPDIYQAIELSKIFSTSLDELTDNDMKDILVDKIIRTEKMAGTTINILKFLSIIVICFLILVICINTIFIVKNKKQYDNEQYIIQALEEKNKEYMANIQTKRISFTINNEKYDYQIHYGKDYNTVGDCFASIESNNDNWKKHFDLIYKKFENHNDARDRIEIIKQYFENNGGSWKEI